MKALRSFLRRHGWLIAMVVIGIPTLRWIAARGKPERLGLKQSFASEPLPLEARYTLSEERSAHTLRLTYRKAAGDPGRITASIPLPPGFHWRYPVAVREDGLFFALVNAPLPASSFPARTKFVRAYHPPRKPIHGRGIHPPSTLVTRLCRLPLSGGPLETILTHKSVGSMALLGDTAYWIAQRPEPYQILKDKTGTHLRLTPASLLMATSLKTRQTHQVADRMPLSTVFLADTDALYWQVGINQPGRPLHTELWRYTPDQSRPVRLTEEWNATGSGLPIALGDRLYWLEDRRQETAETPEMADASSIESLPYSSVLTRTDLVSAREDGTDRRLLVSLSALHNLPALSSLQEHRGRLYILLRVAERKRNTSVTASYLCRLDPGRQNPLVKLLRLPDTSVLQRFQGGYVYYTVAEVDAPWFGNRPVMTHTILYRWKLPE